MWSHIIEIVQQKVELNQDRKLHSKHMTNMANVKSHGKEISRPNKEANMAEIPSHGKSREMLDDQAKRLPGQVLWSRHRLHVTPHNYHMTAHNYHMTAHNYHMTAHNYHMTAHRHWYLFVGDVRAHLPLFVVLQQFYGILQLLLWWPRGSTRFMYSNRF